MRLRALALISFCLAGCVEEEVARPVAPPSSPPVWSDKPSQVALTSSEPAPPPARPRLSRTITLGQDDYSPSAPPPAPPAEGQAGGNVTVNNNIVVQSPPTYGYGYGYGYGSYGRSYGSTGGARVGGDGRFGVGAGSRGAWAPSGWEGAQRTAPRGQTPGVGGNWAPPPSFGPAPMR